MSILNGQRPTDSADVLITIMSIIVYLWMLLSNYLGITKLVTVARLIRLTRVRITLQNQILLHSGLALNVCRAGLILSLIILADSEVRVTLAQDRGP